MKKIDKKMSFAEVLNKYPEAAEVFMNEGMHCFGCAMASGETIEQGCLAHGLNPDEIIEKANLVLLKKRTKIRNIGSS